MRKFFTYMCSALLVCGNALAYFGSYSAYDLYQYASSGDFRTLRSVGSNINASDSNGQTAICYAINNRDYVAYKNLVMLRADEHPNCVKSMPKEDYEDFKRGYELRGGKISSSFSMSSSTVAWTVAGLAAVGAGVAIAAGGGGGGGGGSSDTPSPEPTPPPTPSCEGYNLNACLPNGICEECIGATRSYFKLTGCKEGYVINAYHTGCIPDSSIETEYPLLQCDPNGQCASAMAGDVRRYKLLSCNQGYEMASDGLSCLPICDGYTKEDCDFYTQYISEECSRDTNYHKCAERTVTDHCSNYKIDEDACTSCYGKYKLVNGVCEQMCKGFTQVPCEINTQYTSEVCADDPNYHKCTTRTNKNCASYVPDKDECSACDAEHILIDGACVTKCEGYTQDDCDDEQYISEQCSTDPSYHKCKDRTITDGCMQYEPKADKCTSCYPGYKFNNGVCDQICIGYTNNACPKGTQYISAYCVDDSNFHICTDRTNTSGCADYEIDKDLCTACDSGYSLDNGKCKSVCPDGYQKEPCNINTHYKGDVCVNDPSFHKCVERQNTNACADFDPNDDKCTECVADYSLVNGICQLLCPGYTKTTCPIKFEYEDKYCALDHNFHTCTPRQNVIGCVEFNKTSDDCLKCNGTSETPIAGKCECPGYTTEACDKDTQYMSAECETAAGYHVCTAREYIDPNCKKYDPKADKCLTCVDDYKVNTDGECVHICDGYVTETCEINSHWTDASCPDEADKEVDMRKYHICRERQNIDGCSVFNKTADTCKQCDKEHTLNGEGMCDPNSSLCPGYTQSECNVETQFMPLETMGGIDPFCKYDSSYHRCIQREASSNKCLTYDPNYDKCATCKEGEHLVDGICTKLCPGYQKEECKMEGYYTGDNCEDDPTYHKCEPRYNTMYCTKFVPTEDKCTECKDGYEVKDGACEQICPGFQKECGNGMQPAKDAEGQAIVCSDEHPDYVKCERIPDAKVIPGCRDYTPDNQHCRVCEDWYALIDGGDTCDPQPHVPNCEKPFPNSGICQMCASGFEANEDGTACTRIPSGGDDPDPSEDDCDSLFEHDYGTTTIKGKTMKIDVPCEDYYNLCGQGGGHTRTAYPDGYGNDTDVFTGTSWSPSATPQTPRGHDVWLNEDTGKLESDAYYCGEFNGDEKDFQYVYINRVCKTESGKIYYKCYLRGEGMKYVTGCLEWETNEHGCKKCDTDAGYKIEGSGQFRYCTCPSGDCGGDTPPTPTDCKPYSELGTCPMDTHYYYKGGCQGDTAKSCNERQNKAGCTSYDFYADKCTKCADGYGTGDNTGNNKPDSDGKCPKQSSGGDDPECKNRDCDLDVEYEVENQCDDGEHYCVPRMKISAGCAEYDPNKDECKKCNNQATYYQGGPYKGYCVTSEICKEAQECTNGYINGDLSNVCTGTGKLPCVPRGYSSPYCATYHPEEDKCLTCQTGRGVDGGTTPDKYGRCKGDTEWIGTESSGVTVVPHMITEEDGNGITKYTAVSNKLANFGDKITKYNGYKTDVAQKIVVSGEFNNAADITGAVNTHNGSEKGGKGTVEIVRDSKSDTPITGTVKGLVGGNNYKGSSVVINLDVNDGAVGDKRAFIAGMGKEVGTCKIGDNDEISGIDLGSAEYGQHNAELLNAGSVDITSGGTAPVFGMLGLRHAGNLANHSENKDLGDFKNADTGVININSPNAKEIYAIRVNNLINKEGTGKSYSDVVNEGKINISGGSNVYGISAKNANVYNNGDININATGDNIYGIYADRSNVENNGSITIAAANAGSAYGIYAVNGSTVKNSGIITINNNEYSENTADGKSIFVDPSSYLINSKTIISSSPFNTLDLGGGTVLMTYGSNITAPEVSGTLNLSSGATIGNNADTYIMQNLVTGDTHDLNVVSQSPMFTATINDYGDSSDAVLIRKSFNDLISDSSLADYLEKNYVSGKGTNMFNNLKNLETLTKLKNGIKDLFGQKMLPRMTFEDMSMMREINLDMNKNMFSHEGAFSFGGNVSPYSYVNDVGSMGRYAMYGMNNGKNSYALGISISDVKTYDDKQTNSRSDQSFVMSAPLGHKTHGFELITTPKVGYAYGEYNRSGFTHNYKGKVYKRMYALMNEARYPINVGKMSFTPSAEFNMIGFNVKGSEEAHKPFNLRVPSQNHYSVEAGLGLMAEKEFSLYKYHKFKMNGGVAFYHEFANPYELDVSMSEMDGTYRLHDEKRHANRVAARFGFDYNLRNDLDVSMSMLSNIDGECRTDAVCDMKYHF